MMAISAYPELFGDLPVQWVAYYGEGNREPGADLREMYLDLDSTGDPRVSLSGPCGLCGSERIRLAAIAMDAYGGCMRVCFRCLEESGLLCQHCGDALVVGEAQTWVEVQGETPKPEAVLAVCEPCLGTLEAHDDGP